MNTLFVLEYKVIGLTEAKKLNIPCWKMNFSWAIVSIWSDNFFNNNFNPMSLTVSTPLVATNYRIYNVNSGPFIQKYYSLLPSQLE